MSAHHHERRAERARQRVERERGRQRKNDTQQRARERKRGTFSKIVEEIAAHILRNGSPGPVPNILIGPVVRTPGTSPRHYHFMVAGADADGTFRVDQIAADDRHEAERLRAAVITALGRRPPIVVIDLDDELEMARLCEALWPSEKTTTIRQRVELGFA
jgi:hypothetical protein